MSRIPVFFGMALLLVLALGCAQQQEPLSQATADSLLAQNPIEPPEGDLTPQTQFEEPGQQEPEPEPKAQTPPPPKRRTPPPPTAHTPPPKHQTPPPPRKQAPPPAPKPAPGVELAAGTGIDVEVIAQLSSETAKRGDTWTGEVTENVIVGDHVVIPAGSVVHGVVSGAKPAKKGDRAMLLLTVTSVTANGKDIAVTAGTDSIIAGSPTARNLGAVGAGAGAGALIGKAVGGGKGALIGGLIGGVAAGGAVAKSKGYQVVVKEGTIITFRTEKMVRVKT